jgi:aminoglycoside phosphotransferase family enzyme
MRPPPRVRAPDLAAKVALLRQPQTYPDAPSRIDAVETHMSWVFLTDRHAYKLKKPVRYDYLDFSTLAARRRNCAEEVRLNQALAPGVYLGVVPLALDESGNARLEAEGRVLEWLVKMRRLPADRMLDRLIRDRAVRESEIEELARRLAGFYRQSPAVDIRGEDYWMEYRRMLEANQSVLGDPAYALPPAQTRVVHEKLFHWLERARQAFVARVAAGRVLDGHGDLRPEHICLEPRPVIFDRLEFNRQFRIVDAADELASLTMECERLGAPWIGDILFRAYAAATQDHPPSSLVSFYCAYRACLRARLALLHLRDLEPAAWGKWRALAGDYLRLAAGYSARLDASGFK